MQKNVVLVVRFEELDVGNVDPLMELSLRPPMHPRLHPTAALPPNDKAAARQLHAR